MPIEHKDNQVTVKFGYGDVRFSHGILCDSYDEKSNEYGSPCGVYLTMHQIEPNPTCFQDGEVVPAHPAHIELYDSEQDYLNNQDIRILFDANVSSPKSIISALDVFIDCFENMKNDIQKMDA